MQGILKPGDLGTRFRLLKKNPPFFVSRKMMQRADRGCMGPNKAVGVMVAPAAAVSIQAGV
jgi:hypothetical protein